MSALVVLLLRETRSLTPIKPCCENCAHARHRGPGVMVPNNVPVIPATNRGAPVECVALPLYRVPADFGCVRWEPGESALAGLTTETSE